LDILIKNEEIKIKGNIKEKKNNRKRKKQK
jgi:hypothetical protein